MLVNALAHERMTPINAIINLSQLIMISLEKSKTDLFRDSFTNL